MKNKAKISRTSHRVDPLLGWKWNSLVKWFLLLSFVIIWSTKGSRKITHQKAFSSRSSVVFPGSVQWFYNINITFPRCYPFSAWWHYREMGQEGEADEDEKETFLFTYVSGIRWTKVNFKQVFSSILFFIVHRLLSYTFTSCKAEGGKKS